MIIQGDCLERMKELPSKTVHCCVTSPPYWGLRDYGAEGQLGIEPTPEEYVANLVEVFREVKRVLKDDGTLWINLGDSYANSGVSQPQRDTSGGFGGKDKGTRGEQGYAKASGAGIRKEIPQGIKQKDLVGIPWMVAFALRADGWYLRSDIIWNKPNPMPESVTDRPTKSHEYIFLLSKSQKYYYDQEAIKEPVAQSSVLRLAQNIENQQGSERANGGGKTNGNMKAVGEVDNRNKRTVWTITTKPFSEAHFATYPPELIEPCILAGCPVGGTVLDPFNGAGTTGLVAMQNNREYIGIELNPEYINITNDRLSHIQPVINF